MARAKRDARAFTMRVDCDIAERLEAFCKESGQSKTTAVERALTAYMDEYEKQQEILKQHGSEI